MDKDKLTIRDLEELEYKGPASIQNFVSDEGWEFNPGVPSGAEDGWFSEDLGVVGEIPAEGEGPDGYGAKVVRLTAHDGKLNIWLDDNADPWSANQLERLAALLPDALVRAWAYQPKPWMLDPEELRRHKQEAFESCPVVIPVPPGDQNDPQEGP